MMCVIKLSVNLCKVNKFIATLAKIRDEMRVERDIAGIALPFAAGVVLTTWPGHAVSTLPHLTITIIYLVILGSIAFLLHPFHRSCSSTSVRSVIGICLCFCGILCAAGAEILSTGGSFTGSFISRIMHWGTATGNIIDNIGFTNPDTNAIVKALIIGDRSDIPRHVSDAFRDSGASHTLALSGLHLGIIYGILVKSLGFLGNSRPARHARSAVIVLACGLYTMATGAGASIVRAFLFILLNETARLHGRFRSTGTVLLSSLLIHLLIDPTAISEVGFQLSYAAMAGIAFIFPWLKSFWPEDSTCSTGLFKNRPRPLKWIWTTASMSIACQITTAPLAWFYFGTFPTHFILTNLIAIPLTGIIIPVAVLTLAMSASGICPEILSRACEMLVTALSQALEVISLM